MQSGKIRFHLCNITFTQSFYTHLVGNTNETIPFSWRTENHFLLLVSQTQHFYQHYNKQSTTSTNWNIRVKTIENSSPICKWNILSRKTNNVMKVKVSFSYSRWPESVSYLSKMRTYAVNVVSDSRSKLRTCCCCSDLYTYDFLQRLFN